MDDKRKTMTQRGIAPKTAADRFLHDELGAILNRVRRQGLRTRLEAVLACRLTDAQYDLVINQVEARVVRLRAALDAPGVDPARGVVYASGGVVQDVAHGGGHGPLRAAR